ncbi:MAG TPA: hypothetical protein VKS60_24910 [Stellaceae bacterium]|nr:hypothetical protein [Stellaceae bacterium]
MPGPVIDFVPVEQARPMPRRGVRFRVVMSFGLLAVFAYFMSQHFAAAAGGGVSASAGNWFLLMLLFGTVAAVTAFASFLTTGRLW